jgi:hypothetical protein
VIQVERIAKTYAGADEFCFEQEAVGAKHLNMRAGECRRAECSERRSSLLSGTSAMAGLPAIGQLRPFADTSSTVSQGIHDD